MTEHALQLKGIALLRMAVGLVFLMHGFQKMFIYSPGGVGVMFDQMGIPLPGIFAIVVTIVEFFGGLALLLGLFTRVAALPLAFNMFMAIVLVHGRAGFFGPEGYEYTLTLMFANIALFMTGSGSWALDNVIFHRTHTADESIHMPA